MASNQPSTPSRPFAPDDFRRKRPTIMAPPPGVSVKPAIRSPVTTSHSRPQSRLSNTDTIKTDGIDMQPRMAGLAMMDDWNTISRSKAPLTHSLKSSHFQELQDLADKEWHSRLNERRRSEVQRSSSPIQSTLTQKALMIKSNSTETLTAMSSEVQHRHQSYSAPAREGDDSSLQFTPRSSWDASAAFLLGKNTKGSKRRTQHRTSTPVSDSEYDRYSTELRASIETSYGAQSIVSSSSSRFSLGGDSTRELLYKGEAVKNTQANLYRDQVLKGRSRRAKSLFSSDQVLKPNVPHIETKNQLSSEEKMGQMKRSNKLADMLGEEWRQHAGNDDHQPLYVNISSSSPLKDIVARRNHHKQRRQSEPLQLPFLDIVSSRERQRSSSDAYMLEPGLNIKKEKAKSASTSPSTATCPPLTPLPLGVHPKAAALLGLCVVPNKTSTVPLQQQRIHEQITPGNPTSSSSVEMLKDSESLFSMDKTYAELERMKMQMQGDQSMEFEPDEEAILTREERRRRVRKISRWLGAAVPPHLVQPYPSNGQLRLQVGSGYNNDEAPSLPMTDYMSGAPLFHQRGSAESKWNNTSSSATKPLYKAKAAVNAKLNRKHLNDGTTESPEGPEESMTVPVGSPRVAACTKLEEHKTSVKRNHKLTAVFGEAPPVDLLAEKSPTSPQPVQSFQHRNIPSYQSHQAYISSGPQYNGVPFVAREGDERSIDEHSLNFSLDSRRASSQYRLSIESLEYLIRKNPPLLKDLVCAMEEEDDAASSQATSRGSATPNYNPTLECSGFIAHNSSQESIPEPRPSVDIHHRSNEGAIYRKEKASPKVTEMLENRQRERKVKRHQKLGRWFGELPPQAGEYITGVESEILDVDMKRTPSRQKLAPRSAGSSMKPRSYPRQFSLDDVLTSIEGELIDDDGLHVWEKQELQDRLQALRNNAEFI